MGRLGRKRNVRSPAPAQEKITPSFGEAVKKFKSAAKSAFLVVQGAEKFALSKSGGTGMILNGYPVFREGTLATWNKTM